MTCNAKICRNVNLTIFENISHQDFVHKSSKNLTLNLIPSFQKSTQARGFFLLHSQ